MPVDAPQYPVNLVLTGRRCLVVGGGAVALRKVKGLLACGAEVHVIAPRIDPSISALPGVTVEERGYASGDVRGFRLVIAATDDRKLSQVVFDEADAAGIWVNSADDPERCSFTLPAVAREGALMITVATGGHSPALATWLRDKLAGQLGPEYSVLADLLSEARSELRAEGRSTEGLGWHNALESDMLDLIRGGRISEARERLNTCLSSS